MKEDKEMESRYKFLCKQIEDYLEVQATLKRERERLERLKKRLKEPVILQGPEGLSEMEDLRYQIEEQESKVELLRSELSRLRGSILHQIPVPNLWLGVETKKGKLYIRKIPEFQDLDISEELPRFTGSGWTYKEPD